MKNFAKVAMMSAVLGTFSTAVAKEVFQKDCPHAKADGTCAPAPAPKGDENAKVIKRGAALKGETAVNLKQLLKSPQKYAGKTVRVEAKVRQACQTKGCWAELANNKKGPGVRLLFKDYAFFVPKDSAGRTAKVEGVVRMATLSKRMAKHYEGEGATVPRAKDGTPQEVQIEATGIELHR